jgi:hypothetical protein
MSWPPSVLFALLTAGSPFARQESGVFWLDLDGKGVDTYLDISQTWPLSHFAAQRPYWDAVRMEPVRFQDGRVGWRTGGAAPTNELLWQPLPEPASIRQLGTAEGIRAFQVVYSPAYHAILWELGEGAFFPAVIIAGDESVVLGVHTGRIFQFEDKDVLHVRIQFQGTGHHQQSLFLIGVEGRLVLVQEDETSRRQVVEFFERHGITRHHRGLGFCENSLVEKLLFEGDASGSATGPCMDCRVVVEHRIQGSQLVVDRIEFGDAKDDCEIFPKW